jgi:hypothetical protein
MIYIENHLQVINSTIRSIKAKVELLSGSTLLNTFTYDGKLKSFSIDRVGENKFFGYGISQKLTSVLLDKDRSIALEADNALKPAFGIDGSYIETLPNFYIKEINRDENTNELTITAYDALYEAAKHTSKELVYTEANLYNIAEACAALIGLGLSIDSAALGAFELSYGEGVNPNFDGTETIRDLLNSIAEVTQTIYFITVDNKLHFKRLDISGDAALEITKDKYFKLDSKTDKRLSAVCHATELGDNVIADSGESGETHYIRNNPFWELREDVGQLVESALSAVNGLTINQFNLEWRGNYLLELGDKIKLTTKDNNAVYSYLLNDTITYDGSLKQVSSWSYTDAQQTAANPSSLGEVLKQTYAKVDKANKEIELVASEVSATNEALAALKLNTDSINATVSTISKKEAENAETLSTLTQKVEAQITAEDVSFEITNALANGVNSVETTTGFTFNEKGLTVSKSDSKISTTITEDGMSVYNSNDEVLTANNEGVKAIDLHATTFLIIGTNSRLEDYDNGRRTACFWIGG